MIEKFVYASLRVHGNVSLRNLGPQMRQRNLCFFAHRNLASGRPKKMRLSVDWPTRRFSCTLVAFVSPRRGINSTFWETPQTSLGECALDSERPSGDYPEIPLPIFRRLGSLFYRTDQRADRQQIERRSTWYLIDVLPHVW